ncbi:prostatic acid phosphatase-like isoform X1 [Haliotis rufescens]|uniref:prostatic acid phosphatase-like isoform X1 n=1 Tax=Haliotis rufescens TaxID=6454 RepID=UPI001EAFE62E|nr:prostatic acid phosphatase-like isoform X1 [Haliotis rufescens]
MWTLVLGIAYLVCGGCSAGSGAPSTLRLVNLLYRHGDRSPYATYRSNPNNNRKNVWPNGLGWLTTIGMEQEYSLGRFLRRRYSGFLSDKYLHTEITVESSDVNRCLMSAYSNLAGLYPPSGDQVWNSNIPWQPIPVHTRPRSEDNMLGMGKHCQRYNDLKTSIYKSTRAMQEAGENKDLYTFLTRVTGYVPFRLQNAPVVADNLLCEKIHNVSWAPWVNETMFQTLRELEALSLDLKYSDSGVARLKGGVLLKKWIEETQQRVSSSFYTTKMNMFSAHDSTVLAVLGALRALNHLPPPYSSAILMELHETRASVFHVELYYRNVSSTDPNDDTPPHQLTIPGCTFKCPLTKFVSLTKDMVPTDWDAECAASSTGTIIGRREDQDADSPDALDPHSDDIDSI